MGKHLAPKKKHELSFIKKIKLPSISLPKKAEKTHREKSTSHEKPAAVRAERKLPEMGRYPWIFCVISAVILIAIQFLPLKSWMVPAAYAIPALLALPEHVIGAYELFRTGDRLNSELIICLTAALLFATGLYIESVLLLLLTFFLSLAENRLQKNISPVYETVSKLLPQYASVITDEGIERRDPADVTPGEILYIRAGERIPLDGVITEGITTIDTALISGQRSPWAVNVGYKVYSGCKNLTSDIKIRVSRPFDQSTGSRIARAAEGADHFPSQQENTVTRVLQIYTPVMLLLAVILGCIVPIFKGDWIIYLRRMSVLLIASRPAIELFAIPLLYCKTLSLAGVLGVFIKGKDCLETMAKAETLIFDKTGTITEGRYTVTDVFPVKMSEKQLLTIAAAAESFSRHPISAAIREAAGKLDDRIVKSVRIREIPGRGISALVGNRQVYVGNAALLEEYGIKYNIPSRPGTAIHVAVDSRYCGHIIVADKVRRRAFDALETLRINGIKKLVLLSGDVLSVARPVASRLNFDMLRAELTPSEKAKAVAYLMKNKGIRSSIAFVGEGENSGKIMTGADVGIAMGSLGSDSAFASADVMIMDKDIFKIPKTLVYSRLAYKIAWENFAAGAVFSLLVALLGIFGLVSPLTGEIVLFVMGIAMLGNTLRLK